MYNKAEPKHITNFKSFEIPTDIEIWYIKYNLIIEFR